MTNPSFFAQPIFYILVILLLSVLINLFFLRILISAIVRKIGDVHTKLKEEIRFSLQPIGDIPMGVEEITELATEIWRIEQRLSKTADKISDVHKKGLENSVQRLKRYLQKFDVEIQDYTGQKYNDGFNFDILSREQDPSLEHPIIKETVEPTITCRGRIVKKAKVILASNQV